MGAFFIKWLMEIAVNEAVDNICYEKIGDVRLGKVSPGFDKKELGDQYYITFLFSSRISFVVLLI